MAESRPVPNPELLALGPKLDKPGRDKLNQLGFDMQGAADGRNNFHNLYADAPKAPAHRYVGIFLPEFEKAAKRLEAIGGGVVINLTPGSALKCFPERSLDWALENRL